MEFRRGIYYRWTTVFCFVYVLRVIGDVGLGLRLEELALLAV